MEVLDKDGLDYFWDKVKDYVDSNIQSKININVPVGTIMIWSGETIPHGWAECNGGFISIMAYNELFNVIGYQYSLPEDDEDTLKYSFRLPNITGRMVVGQTATFDEFAYLGNTGGSRTHTQTVEEMPSHTHTNTVRAYWGNAGNTSAEYYNISTATGTNWNNRSWMNYNSTTGDGNPMDIMNPYIVLKYIIKIEPTEV